MYICLQGFRFPVHKCGPFYLIYILHTRNVDNEMLIDNNMFATSIDIQCEHGRQMNPFHILQQ